MTPRPPVAALALAALTFLFPVSAQADCAALSGLEACVRDWSEDPVHLVGLEGGAMRGGSAASTMAKVGEVLPRGRYSIILNADYYGLPPVSDGWVYMRVGQDAFRVDWRTHQVLERVTDRVAANF